METSADGPKAKCHDIRYSAAIGVKAEAREPQNDADDPEPT